MHFHKVNNELLIRIAGYLPQEDLKTFSFVCHKFMLIAHSDAVWKERLYNNFGITYKLPDETWKEMYARKSEDATHSKMCPHIGYITPKVLAPYAVKYQQVLNWLPKNLNCTTCGASCKDSGLCLYVWKGNVRNRKCLYIKKKDVAENSFFLLLRL